MPEIKDLVRVAQVINGVPLTRDEIDSADLVYVPMNGRVQVIKSRYTRLGEMEFETLNAVIAMIAQQPGTRVVLPQPIILDPEPRNVPPIRPPSWEEERKLDPP